LGFGLGLPTSVSVTVSASILETPEYDKDVFSIEHQIFHIVNFLMRSLKYYSNKNLKYWLYFRKIMANNKQVAAEYFDFKDAVSDQMFSEFPIVDSFMLFFN
jgi:hypothetical protein